MTGSGTDGMSKWGPRMISPQNIKESCTQYFFPAKMPSVSPLGNTKALEKIEFIVSREEAIIRTEKEDPATESKKTGGK